MKPRVLVVEDEDDLRSIVEYNLRLAGYDTVGVGTARDALQAVAKERPDLVVLDLMLPDFPGTQVCREIKDSPATRDVAVLMLTAKSEEVSRVTGLEIGADDYVVKPVSMKELVLRVGAILRRKGTAAPAVGRAAGSNGESLRETIQTGELRIDLPGHRVTVAGKRVELTPLEFRLLSTLLERAGRVQTRESLLQDVWEASLDLTSRTVDTHVKRLRAKLGETGERIETVRGLGYRFRGEDERS